MLDNTCESGVLISRVEEVAFVNGRHCSEENVFIGALSSRCEPIEIWGEKISNSVTYFAIKITTVSRLMRLQLQMS